MKKKLCVIGNSHVAALKSGWEKMRDDFKDIEVTFFASAGKSLSCLELRGASLVPRNKPIAEILSFTSGGLSEVAIPDYSAFLCYGLGLQLPALDQRLSTACSNAVLRDALDQSLNLRIARMLRSATQAPIYVAHNPQQATSHEPEKTFPRQSYATLSRELGRLLEPDALALAAQPASTLDDDWTTKSHYASGSVRLDTGRRTPNRAHPDNERVHMNGAFGTAYLSELFRSFAQH